MSTNNKGQEDKLERLRKAQAIKDGVMLKNPISPQESFKGPLNSSSLENKIESGKTKNTSTTTSIWIRKSVVEKIDELMEAYGVKSRARFIEIFTEDEE